MSQIIIYPQYFIFLIIKNINLHCKVTIKQQQPITQNYMSQRCLNCQLTRYKLNQLMNQYQQLIRTKQEEIICSHRIIAELQHQISQSKRALAANGHYAKEIQKNTHKILYEQQQTIEYLKQREVKLVQQLKNTENQIFKLAIDVQENAEINKMKNTNQRKKQKPLQNSQDRKFFVTPKKNTLGSTNPNITMNKDGQNCHIDRLHHESGIKLGSSDQKDSIKLKVTEDKLQLMNIKYKMALLKTVQIATLR